MARAFRDFSGTVYLVASSSEMFQNLGPTLEDVHHTCQPAFQSVGDPDPTGIIHFRGWYYAVATAWTWPPNCSGQRGPGACLISGGAPIRTPDVFDPSSWRAWDGTDFTVRFVDPYLGPVTSPQEHVYAPVSYMSYVYEINIFRHAGGTGNDLDLQNADECRPGDLVFATLWDVYDNNLGPQGLYFSTTTDPVSWTKPTLVVTLEELLAHDPPGSFYAYFSVLDPHAPDRNFTIVGDHAYLFYTRLNSTDNLDRVLFRQPIELHLHR
jgi:hypothetical protein